MRYVLYMLAVTVLYLQVERLGNLVAEKEVEVAVPPPRDCRPHPRCLLLQLGQCVLRSAYYKPVYPYKVVGGEEDGSGSRRVSWSPLFTFIDGFYYTPFRHLHIQLPPRHCRPHLRLLLLQLPPKVTRTFGHEYTGGS